MNSNTLSEADEVKILTSPATHKLVFEVLKLAESKDPADATNDVEIAAHILASRFERRVAEQFARLLDRRSI